MTATATMPRRKAKTAQPKIPAKWRKVMGLIPGYDPIATAAPGDRFVAAEAERVVEQFFPMCLKHVKGPIAGQPFILEPWQKGVVGAVFGWQRADGLRRYREVFLYVGKKNGKSALAAGVMLFLLTADGEAGAECYSAAASRDQAAIIFSHASGMVRQDDYLSNLLTVYGAKGGSVVKAIVCDETMSSYKCLAADANTADGTNPHGVVIDELHRHRTPELADVLQKSTAARAQPVVLYTTTADYNRESLCNTKLKYARGVRDGGIEDPSFLPAIFEASRDDDWTLPETWRKANPNMDVTIPQTFLARECKKAQDTPAELNNFLRLHLNIVTDSDVAWLDIAQWDKCGEQAVDPAALEGRRCHAGIDLSSTKDITALSLLFPPDDEESAFTVLSYFWIPEDSAKRREDRDRVLYQTWAHQGFIETTPGNVVDYDCIRKKINSLNEVYNIAGVSIDRWNSTHLQTQLQGDGFDVVQFGQGFSSMSAPTKELEKLILSCAINHGGNPVLRWMAGNVMVEIDAAGNLKPSKKKSTEKIDGIVSLIMALGVSMVAEEESMYETCGVQSI